MREFRSKLVPLLHSAGMDIIPITLTIGDYILSPNICIERKSISDLFQSFASGRLITQVENMLRNYTAPMLLIEFDENQAFSLQKEIPEEIQPQNIISKLVVLTQNFPKLRILWSRSPFQTAGLFKMLKTGQPEPLEEGNNIQNDDDCNEDSLQDSLSQFDPVDILRRLPGITEENYRTVVLQVGNLKQLAEMKKEEIQKLIGPKNGQELYHFFHQPLYPQNDTGHPKRRRGF